MNVERIRSLSAELADELLPVINRLASMQWDGMPLSRFREMNSVRGAESRMFMARGILEMLVADEMFWRRIVGPQHAPTEIGGDFHGTGSIAAAIGQDEEPPLEAA